MSNESLINSTKIRRNVFLFLFLLCLNVNVFSQNKNLDKELKNAVYDGNITKIEELLKDGANPNGAKDETFRTPLCYACLENQIPIVKLLLQFGADPNYKIERDHYPLFYVLNGEEKIELLKIMIDYGMDINITEKDRVHDVFNVISLNHTQTLKILIDSGLDVKNIYGYGKTLEQYCKQMGYKTAYEIITTGVSNTNEEIPVITDNSKLFKNLLNYVNDNSENTIWKNESIILPARSMVVVAQVPYYGLNRYLLSIPDKIGLSGPIILDLEESEQLNITYNNYISNEIRIRFAGYAKYTSNDIEISTYHFVIDKRKMPIKLFN